MRNEPSTLVSIYHWTVNKGGKSRSQEIENNFKSYSVFSAIYQQYFNQMTNVLGYRWSKYIFKSLPVSQYSCELLCILGR